MLTKSQHRIIAERLAQGLEEQEVASRLGVGLGYIINLQKDPDFQALLGQIETGETTEETEPEDLRRRILEAVPSAVDVMIELMGDARQNGQTRLKAAEWILAREATIAAMEARQHNVSTVQQIVFDHRASQALQRLIGENAGETWLKELETRLEEMPPSVE